MDCFRHPKYGALRPFPDALEEIVGRTVHENSFPELISTFVAFVLYYASQLIC
ncbi:hypothetical protein M378DRAFT_165086 [Amanita muscaria Koide BX008]|uniref:Uncharacterized protein n=1 Tax=Amanita muscaria (strain Koide BX008) TaxID=946122 RepID=A0A0C2T8P3_AMAMK|nr:hypothetical protein M378DRAFT_165086 [Amanita muscaria Koide BX008]